MPSKPFTVPAELREIHDDLVKAYDQLVLIKSEGNVSHDVEIGILDALIALDEAQIALRGASKLAAKRGPLLRSIA